MSFSINPQKSLHNIYSVSENKILNLTKELTKEANAFKRGWAPEVSAVIH